MNKWLIKISETDSDRMLQNISRLENLLDRLKYTSEMVIMSQSIGFNLIKQLLDQQIVKGHKRIWEKINTAFIGKNNQKIVLDSPNSVKQILIDSMKLVNNEITNLKYKLKQSK